MITRAIIQKKQNLLISPAVIFLFWLYLERDLYNKPFSQYRPLVKLLYITVFMFRLPSNFQFIIICI